MNILPKKRWHVRTKDNIARVRRDEAQARDEERKRQEKLELAESEARVNFLRKKSGLPERTVAAANAAKEDACNQEKQNESLQHVDLFADYKSHVKTTNKDLEKEKKEEQEKYEKQIGYLTYLGQDTNEALKLRSWYEVAPKRAQVGETGIEEKDLKSKHSQDPLTLINALLPPEKAIKPSSSTTKSSAKAPKNLSEECSSTSKLNLFKQPIYVKSNKSKKEKKVKKHKHKKSRDNVEQYKFEKKQRRRLKEEKRKQRQQLEAAEEQQKREKLEKLRKERIQRESIERARQEALLAPKDDKNKEPAASSQTATPRIVQKYNSQFNPELAKQNLL